jgi:hypothetical protein
MCRSIELGLQELGQRLELELAWRDLGIPGMSMSCLDSLMRLFRKQCNVGAGLGVRRITDLGQANTGNAIDRRMMHFRVNGELAILQALDQVHLPERAAAIE